MKLRRHEASISHFDGEWLLLALFGNLNPMEVDDFVWDVTHGIWIYLSWVVVLLGAEAAFAHQHLEMCHPSRGALAAADLHERVALSVMLAIGQRFQDGDSP